MTYSIQYTPEAVRDMDAIWDGVLKASGSYDIADRYIDELTSVIAAKKAYPFTGTPLEYRGLFTGFYSLNYKKYKAFYRVHNGYIEVLRIIMSKRNYMKILFGETEDTEDEL